MNDVRIRRGTDDDVEGAAALRWVWVTEEKSGAASVGRGPFIDQFVRWAREHSLTHHLFVAERDDELIGTAWLAITSRVPSPRSLERKSGDLQSVYVVPEVRGRGIGSALIAEVTEAARRAGIERLTVHSSEGAITAYSRAGFASAETLRHLSLTAL